MTSIRTNFRINTCVTGEGVEVLSLYIETELTEWRTLPQLIEIVTQCDVLDLEVVSILHVAGRYPLVGNLTYGEAWLSVACALAVPARATPPCVRPA